MHSQIQTVNLKTIHLSIRPLSHTHHEEEESTEENSFHGGDNEKRIGEGTRRPDGHCWQILQGNRTEIQFLRQSEAVGQQSQWCGDQTTENQITHPLFNHLHLKTRNRWSQVNSNKTDLLVSEVTQRQIPLQSNHHLNAYERSLYYIWIRFALKDEVNSSFIFPINWNQ